jgi:hypothetical protein
MALPGVNTELAAAVRAVNAAYNRLPQEGRPDPAAFDPLEQEVDAACLSEDRERALAAIREWRNHWLGLFQEAAGQGGVQQGSTRFPTAFQRGRS